MNDLFNPESTPRRTMVLFFVVDASYSMDGAKIGALNQAISETMPILGDISASNADAEIKIAILKFSSGCEWMYDEPKLADEFIWQDIQTEGLTDLGAACIELNNKLSRKAFLNEVAGSFAPVLLLLSDGGPTDDFQNGLKKLKANKWYQAAIKIAIAIGNDANKDVLKDFTGNIESVIETHNIESLKKMIRTITVTSSTIGSQSSTSVDKDKQTQVIETIKNDVKEEDGAALASDDNNDFEDEWD